MREKEKQGFRKKINFNLQIHIAFINEFTVLKFLCDCFYPFSQVALQAQHSVHFISTNEHWQRQEYRFLHPRLTIKYRGIGDKHLSGIKHPSSASI